MKTNSFIKLVAILFSGLLVNACSSNKDEPDIPLPESIFKSILTIEEGQLADIPHSVFSFGEVSYDKVVKFEEEHGAKLKGEHSKSLTIVPGNGSDPIKIDIVTYTFDTKDPSGDNPTRTYTFDKAKKTLIKAQIMVKTSLVMKNTKDLQDLFLKALEKRGYKSEEDMTYQNGKIELSIKSEKDICTFNYEAYTKKEKEDTGIPFIKGAKDFPLLIKNPLNMTKEEIEAFENKLDLRVLKQRDNLKQGQFRYVIKKESIDKSNIAQVVYGTQIVKDSKGNDQNPSITIISLSFSSLEDFLLEDKGKAWMKNNGFIFEKKASIGKLQYAKFKSTDSRWQAFCIFDSNALLISLTYIEQGGGSEPPTDKVRFFLPLIDWTAKVIENGKITEFEKARNFETRWSIHKGYDDDDPDIGKGKIYAYPSYKIASNEKNRFSGMTYYSKSKDDMTMDLVFISIDRGTVSKPNNPSVDDKDINDYIKSEGFTFVEKDVQDLGITKIDYILYVNKEKQAQIILLKGRGAKDTLFINLVKDGSYTPKTAIKKIVKLIGIRS